MMDRRRIRANDPATAKARSRRVAVAACVVLALGAALPAGAVTVSFREGANGYAGTQDTFLRQNPADVGTNQGASAAIGWDGDDPSGTGYDQYTLLRFDNIIGNGAGQIPAGTVITSATLTYTVFDPGDAASVHRVLTAWTEASTYTSFCAGSCDQGVEYGPSVGSATATANGNVAIDVTASVQAWADGEANLGWFFLPGGPGGVDLRSSEHGTVAERPLLTVIYGEGQPSAGIVRAPYLQLGTPTSTTIVWRTDTATDSRVRYGTTPGVLDQTVTIPGAVTNHIVPINGLAPSTRYYYDVGSSSGVQAGGTTEHYFETSPPAGTAARFTAWVVGDSGTGDSNQASVRDAMLAYTGADRPAMMLHVGDIAYTGGTEQEFTDKHFAPYANIFRHMQQWPTLGNHEGLATTSGAPGPSTGPYYDAFVLPANAEAGGEPSGTEAYYSFDYANVHFIVLNAYQVDRSPTGAMAQWVQQDLASTTAQWVVAYWHHPPYSKGTHNSDTEIELIQMRQNLLPILEAGGVDLVLSGHSHCYERSYLIDGTYTTPTPSFATLVGAGNILDDGDGRITGDGEYRKSAGQNPHEGAVYVVAGHGGASLGGSFGHPVMYYAEARFGSGILEVDGNVLNFTNLRADGVVSDTFTIVKGPLPPRVSSTEPHKDAVISTLTQIQVTFSTDVTGVDPTDLTVNGSQATAVVANSAAMYTFTGFPAPGLGTAQVVLAADGIADASNPSLTFAGDSWFYTLDPTAPRVASEQPPRDTEVGRLDSITVTFSKAVFNVTPDDLLVDGQPATQVQGLDGTAGPYTFRGYPTPQVGLASVQLLANGIVDDLAQPFAGDSWTYALRRDLVINEFLASNNTAAQDDFGEFDDYIEIYNPGTTTVDMSGMHLSDVTGYENQYRIPDGVTIAPGGYLVFWCDGQPAQGPLHTNFNLARTGETIGLYGTVADSYAPIDVVPYTTQTSDVASGRFPDGAAGFVLMAATPNAPNAISCTGDAQCVALTDDCNVGRCVSLECVRESANEGLACDDGIACLGGEVCTAGVCGGGTDTCPVGDVCNQVTGICGPPPPADPLPIVVGDDWRYFKGTSEPPSDWNEIVFDDTSWLLGAGGFGYGPDCTAQRGTTLTDMQNSYYSLYTRREFSIANPNLVTSLSMTVDYDDALVVYLNGTEVWRSASMGGTPGIPPAYNQASGTADRECSNGSPANPAENIDLTSQVGVLQAGTNVLAIQGHNGTLGSSDFTIVATLSSVEEQSCDNAGDCDDANPCTDDNCIGNVCSNTVDDTNTCTDGVLCTTDVCSAGACVSTSNCPVGQICDAPNDVCVSAPTAATFQQGTSGYAGAIDTFLHAGGADTNNGAAVTLIVDGPGTNPPDERQTLIQFSNLFVSQGGPIPDGATITQATLTLQISNASADGANLHRMLVPWTAASTWNTLGSGVQTNGVEAVAALDAASFLNSLGSHTINVTSSVQAWAAGASNYGWVLVSPPAGTADSWQFDSAEGATVANRPRLTVQYTVAATCTTNGECDDANACNGTETCVGNVCQAGTPLTCADSNPCTTDSCNSVSGCTYTPLSDGTACSDGTYCNGAETCQAGTCAAGTAPDCDDAVACTDDACNESLDTCTHASNCPGGQTCNTSTGVCQSAPATATFRQGASGYAGAADTYVHAGGADTNNGAAVTLIVDGPGGAATDVRQTLIRFDNLFASQGGPIPDGATINSATLTLQITNISVDGANFHRMLVPWTAASTWNSLGTGVQTDGVEAVAAFDVSSFLNSLGSHAVDVTASVQAWAAGATNHGWVLISPPAGTSDSWQFDSSEGATVTNRPMLTVEYQASITCTTPADCNDGNPCTDDVCSGDVCSNPANDANSCSDGVACTNDVCSAGTCASTSNCPGGQTCNTSTGVCESAPQTATFQEGVGGFAGTQDTILRQNTADVSTDYGADPAIGWDADDPSSSGFDQYALLRFENVVGIGPGQIPAGSAVTSATLRYTVFDIGDVASVHEVLTSWTESSTYSSFCGASCDQGTEFGPSVASATAVATGNVTIDVTASVQGWVSGVTTNRGWFFLPSAAGGVDVRSSEYATAAERPLLTVEYIAATGCTIDDDCDDDDVCNGSETCVGNVCQAGTPLACADTNPCTADTCDPLTGCANAPVPNGTACADGAYCNGAETCQAGTCTAGTAPNCSDSVACTDDACDETLDTCTHLSNCPVGENCNLSTGVCEQGPTAPPLPIQVGDDWTYFKGVSEPPVAWKTVSFDDTSWLVGAGGFGYGPDCTAQRGTTLSDMQEITGTQPGYLTLYTRRTFAVADPSRLVDMELTVDYDDAFVAYLNGVEVFRSAGMGGTVGVPPAYNQAPTSTTNHECSGGSPANPADVVDLTANLGLLTTGVNVLAIQGHNVNLPSSDFSLIATLTATESTACSTSPECDDGNACNGVETCVGNVCQPGTALVCADANPCTTDACVPASGCVYTPLANGTACTDGAYCNGLETCQAGACAAGAAPNCDDAVGCTIDACDEGVDACTHAPSCPSGQTCNLSTGTCQTGAPISVTFRQGVSGYTGTLDTFVHAGSPSANNGAATTLIVDGPTTAAPGDERQTLVRFGALFASEGGPIPDGATIESATLTLQITNPSLDGAELHRMLVGWNALASWSGLVSGVQLDGIEAVATADAASFYNGTTPFAQSIDVTPSVQAWAAGAANFGWVMVSPPGGDDSWQFDSAEGGTPPLLAVTYQDDTGPDGRLVCELSSATAPPGGSVGVIVRLENDGGLDGIRGFQTQVGVDRTSGAGSAAIPCPGGVAVDEGRPDYLFAGRTDTYPAINCALARASSSLLSGSVVAPSSSYVSQYTVDVLPDATQGSTFAVSIQPYPDSSLANLTGEPVPFEIGAPCVITVEAGGCNPAACDDGNVCTTDGCENDACAYSASGVCGAAGAVRYYRNNVGGVEPSTKAVPNVGIDVDQDPVANATTGGAGTYAVPNLAGTVQVRTLPKLGSTGVSDLNGAITSFDASLIAQHVVGAGAPLSSNQLIAADVTGNGTVSSFDASRVAQLAVGQILHFDVAVATGSDWRFFRCDNYVSASSQDCAAPTYLHDPLTGPVSDDFYALLYGEVSGNWNPSAGFAGGAEEVAAYEADRARAAELGARADRRPRSSRPGGTRLTLSGGGGAWAEGETRRIAVTLDDASGIEGLDLVLSYDPNRIEVRDVRGEGVGLGLSTASHTEGGTTRIAMYGVEPLEGSGVVLTFTVTARHALAAGLPIAVGADANEGLVEVKVSGRDRGSRSGR